MKIEKRFVTDDGTKLNLVVERNHYNLYVNEDNDLLLVANKKGEVIDKIEADCGQNMGYFIINGK